MMPGFQRPPRGAVKLHQVTASGPGGHASWRVECTACGWTAPSPGRSANRTAAEEAKRCHQCRDEVQP